MAQENSVVNLFVTETTAQHDRGTDLKLLTNLVTMANDFRNKGRVATAELLMGIANMFCEDADLEPADFFRIQ